MAKKSMKKKAVLLQPGDMVVPREKGTAPSEWYCVLWVSDDGKLARYGHLKSGDRYLDLARKVRRVRKIGPDLEKVIKAAGLAFAVVACQDHLPKRFLPTLNPEQLMAVWNATSSMSNIDVKLKKRLQRLMADKGVLDQMRQEKQQPLTAQHVRDVCKLGCGEAACSFGMLGLEGAECAKADPQAEGYITMRRFAGNMVAKGDNCVGRTGKVSSKDIKSQREVNKPT